MEFWAHLTAILLAGAALVARVLLDPYLVQGLPYTFFILATIVALFKLGPRPALTTAVLGFLFARWFFIQPYFSLQLNSLSHLLGLFGYAAITVGLFHLARIRATGYEKALALRENEEELEAFFENAAIGMVKLDARQRFVRVNEKFCQITGYSSQELQALSPADITEHSDWEQNRIYYEQFISGERQTYEVETRHIHKQGHRIWVQVAAVLLPDPEGGPPCAAAVVQDITERKNTEEELRRSAQELRELADAMPQMVWVARPDGHGEYFNKRWYEYTGSDFDDWTRFLHPADRRATVERWRHSLTTGEPYEIRFRLRRASDGAYRWQLGRALPVKRRQRAHLPMVWNLHGHSRPDEE